MVQEWVSIADQLPAAEEYVLLYDKHEGECLGSFYSTKNCFISKDDGRVLPDVFYWLKLPPPPEAIMKQSKIYTKLYYSAF